MGEKNVQKSLHSETFEYIKNVENLNIFWKTKKLLQKLGQSRKMKILFSSLQNLFKLMDSFWKMNCPIDRT